MTVYLLDSTPLNRLVEDASGVRMRVDLARADGHVVGTITPVLAEFFGGLAASRTAPKESQSAADVLATLDFWLFDVDAAIEYASLYATMRRQGVTIQPVDLMLAAVARLLPDAVVVSSDGDLYRVPGLAVEDWVDD